jgi:hypothetical protein
VEGIVVCFLKVSLFGAYTKLFKNKKYMLFSRRCGSFLKKNNHTSHPNTLNPHLSISLGLMLVVRGGTCGFYLALLFSYVFFNFIFFNNFIMLILKIN